MLDSVKKYQQDPGHPSVRLKRLSGGPWSARVNREYRALAYDVDRVRMFIGLHDAYERRIARG